jgi:heat shock 70kDa protein 1/2/6/8
VLEVGLNLTCHLFCFQRDRDRTSFAWPCVGIDLGTTYSCVGIWQNDRVEIIPNDQGDLTTPSWVAFLESETLIGQAAKAQAARNPRNTVFAAKRLIGLNIDDPAIVSDLKHWPFKVIAKEGNKPYFEGE